MAGDDFNLSGKTNIFDWLKMKKGDNCIAF
jgi:hypothetical protein